MRQGQRTPPGFGAIWSCVALDLIGFGIVLPILPLYAENERFGADAATVGLLVASFSLAQLVFAPLTGWLSDRVGRKPVLVLSLAGTSVGSLITGLAGSLWVLFLGRIVDGISGSSVSVAQAAVADLAPPEQRARLLGYLGAAFGVGFVAGPAIGALAVLGGIHVPFIVVAVVAGINALVALRRLPETRPVPVSGGRPPEPAPEVAPAPLTVQAEGVGVGGYITVTFVVLVAFSAFEATFALFVERRLDLRMVAIYVTFVGVGLLITLVQVGLVHPCVRRIGEGATVRLGLTLNASGMLILAAVESWITLVPALVLLTVGQGLITPVLSSLVAGAATVGRRGGTLGVQQAAGGLARVVGPVAGGFLLQFAGLSAPYVAGAALLVAAVLLLRAPLRAEVPAAP